MGNAHAELGAALGSSAFDVLPYKDAKFPIQDYDNLTDWHDGEKIEGMLGGIEFGSQTTIRLHVGEYIDLSFMEDKLVQKEAKRAIPLAYRFPKISSCESCVGNVSMLLECPEDTTASLKSRVASVQGMEESFHKLFETGLSQVSFKLIYELVQCEWQCPIGASEFTTVEAGKRWLHTVTWGVYVQGTVEEHNDPMEVYREKLRTDKQANEKTGLDQEAPNQRSRQGVTRQIKKNLGLDDDAVEAFFKDYDEQDAARQKRKSQGRKDGADAKLLDWRFDNNDWMELPLATRQEMEELQRKEKTKGPLVSEEWKPAKIEEKTLTEALPLITAIFGKAAVCTDRWRPFVSCPLVVCRSATDYVDAARKLKRSGHRAKMFDNLQHALITCAKAPTPASSTQTVDSLDAAEQAAKMHVLSRGDRDWSFAQYKDRIDELVGQKRRGELKDTVFEESVRKTCSRLLTVIERSLLPAAVANKDKVEIALYTRLKADYLRYMCKFTECGAIEIFSFGRGHECEKTNAQVAEESYEGALRLYSDAADHDKKVEPSPISVPFINTAINHALFEIEVKRNYASAVHLCQDMMTRCTAQEKVCTEWYTSRKNEEFKMPVGETLSLRLLLRIERVLNSEFLVLEVQFERDAFRAALKARRKREHSKAARLAAAAEAQVNNGTESQSHMSPKTGDLEPPAIVGNGHDTEGEDADAGLQPSQPSQPAVVKIASSSKSFRVACCGGQDEVEEADDRPIPTPRNGPTPTPRSARGSARGGFGRDEEYEALVQAWVKHPALTVGGLRWVETVRSAPRAGKYAFHLAARVNLDKVQGVTMADLALPLESTPSERREQRDKKRKIATKVVEDAVRLEHIEELAISPQFSEATPQLGAKSPSEVDFDKAPLTARSGGESVATSSYKVAPMRVESAQVLAVGPYCEIQEFFKGLDLPFMTLADNAEQAAGVSSDSDFVWLARRVANFELTQVCNSGGTGSGATFHAHNLSARRNPVQSASRGPQ